MGLSKQRYIWAHSQTYIRTRKTSGNHVIKMSLVTYRCFLVGTNMQLFNKHGYNAYVMIFSYHVVRLVGGSYAHEGRVELFYNGAWGTVCDDSWDTNDASVVCRQLGYGSASEAVIDGRFGPGVGRILLDDVNCNGNESHIASCLHGGIGSHNCLHSEDAGAVCQLNSKCIEPVINN